MEQQDRYHANNNGEAASRPSFLRRAWNSAVEFVEESWPLLGPVLGLSAGGAATYFTGNPLYLGLGLGGVVAFGTYVGVGSALSYRQGERDLRRGMIRGVGREVHNMRRVRPVEQDVFDGVPTARTERVAPEAVRGRRNSMNGDEIEDSFRSDGASVDALFEERDAANASSARKRRVAANRDDVIVEDILSPASAISPQGVSKAAADQARGRFSSAE